MSLRRHPFDPSRLCSNVQTYRRSICSSNPAVAPQVTRRAPTFMQRVESIHVPRPVQFTTRSTPPVPGDARLPDDLPHGFAHVLLGVVDDVVRAELAQPVELVGAVRARDHGRRPTSLASSTHAVPTPPLAPRISTMSSGRHLGARHHHAVRRRVCERDRRRHLEATARAESARAATRAPRRTRRGRRRTARRSCPAAGRRIDQHAVSHRDARDASGPSSTTSPAISEPMISGNGSLMPGMPRRLKMSW